MSSINTFLILIAIITISTTSATDESCIAQIVASSSQCFSSINIPPTCKSAILNLSKTGYQYCTAVNLMWSNPKNNLTLIIETSFAQQRQAYGVSINNRLIQDYSLKIYRILNDQETEIKSNDDKIIQYSDVNYQIIIKLQGPAKYYSFPIMYDVVQS